MNKTIKKDDMVYVFMGETLLRVKITCPQFDSERLLAEDDTNSYCLYIKDCYSYKEDAIAGILNSIQKITDCDCGEDEAQIQQMFARILSN